MFLFELIVLIVILTIPGYLLVGKYFQRLEKAVLSIFLSLSVTSFLFYIVISFFGISKEFIRVYAFLLLVAFFVVKKFSLKQIIKSIQNIKLKRSKNNQHSLPELLLIFLLVFILSINIFFVPINRTLNYDDASYHLPIILDVADDGKKTFFSETHNTYQLRSNQFPLLFESFAGAIKFFIKSDFFWFINFFALVLSLFLIYFISKQVGFNEFYSVALYGLTPFILIFTRYFGVENFLAMFFLGAVFFVLKFVEEQKLIFLGFAGFLSGLMFLTKFTGGIFFAGLFLFLLYKRKFKESLFFALIFVLFASVFFIVHFEVPFDQSSVGEYGELAAEKFPEIILLNAFIAGERLFSYFFSNFYIFFIPILFFVGLFWKKEKEKNFLFLLLFSGSCLIFATLVSKAAPSYSGFPRYFWPIYSLLCVFAGFQLKKIIIFKEKRIALFAGAVFISIILFTSILFLQYFDFIPSKKSQENNGKGIENNYGVTVWFLNNSALVVNLDKVVAYDYVWRADFSGEPCDFLKKHEIDYVVYNKIDIDPDFLRGSPDNLGDFGSKLRTNLLEGKCAELISKSNDPNNSAIFKILNNNPEQEK